MQSALGIGHTVSPIKYAFSFPLEGHSPAKVVIQTNAPELSVPVRPFVRLCPLRVVLNDTLNSSVFDEISVLHRNQRGLNLHEYEPQLTRKTIVRPAQNRHHSSNARGSHPRGCPTGVGLTRRQVSVPWGVKSITNSSRYKAQRDKKSQLQLPSASSFGRPPRCGYFANSTKRAQKPTAPSATSHTRAVRLPDPLHTCI